MLVRRLQYSPMIYVYHKHDNVSSILLTLFTSWQIFCSEEFYVNAHKNRYNCLGLWLLIRVLQQTK